MSLLCSKKWTHKELFTKQQSFYEAVDIIKTLRNVWPSVVLLDTLFDDFTMRTNLNTQKKEIRRQKLIKNGFLIQYYDLWEVCLGTDLIKMAKLTKSLHKQKKTKSSCVWSKKRKKKPIMSSSSIKEPEYKLLKVTKNIRHKTTLHLFIK